MTVLDILMLIQTMFIALSLVIILDIFNTVRKLVVSIMEKIQSVNTYYNNPSPGTVSNNELKEDNNPVSVEVKEDVTDDAASDDVFYTDLRGERILFDNVTDAIEYAIEDIKECIIDKVKLPGGIKYKVYPTVGNLKHGRAVYTKIHVSVYDGPLTYVSKNGGLEHFRKGVIALINESM